MRIAKLFRAGGSTQEPLSSEPQKWLVQSVIFLYMYNVGVRRRKLQDLRWMYSDTPVALLRERVCRCGNCLNGLVESWGTLNICYHTAVDRLCRLGDNLRQSCSVEGHLSDLWGPISHRWMVWCWGTQKPLHKIFPHLSRLISSVSLPFPRRGWLHTPQHLLWCSY